MKDFVQHRLALERAWADTNPDNFAETLPITEPDEPAPDVDPEYLDDLWTDIVRFCALMGVWLMIYLIFTR